MLLGNGAAGGGAGGGAAGGGAAAAVAGGGGGAAGGGPGSGLGLVACASGGFVETFLVSVMPVADALVVVSRSASLQHCSEQ